MENVKQIAAFIQKMKQKYKPEGRDKIVLVLEENELVVYENGPLGYEPDWWNELERIKIE